MDRKGPLAGMHAELAGDCAGRVAYSLVVGGDVIHVFVEQRPHLLRDRLGQRAAALPEGIKSERRQRVGELHRRAVGTGGIATAFPQSVVEAARAGRRHLRPRRRDVETAVVVRSAGESDLSFVSWPKTVSLGELREVAWRYGRSEPSR